MIVPDPAFRPNANRAVYVQGVIDQQLVNRLTSRIIFLQSQSREPLTIFIDSPGGHVASMETILKLLKASNQDFAPACRLITVVTSRAASAAADLLSSGDYAIAYPDSTLLYHGIRMSQSERPLTAEVTSLLANMLRMSNDSYAMELARKIEFRFMFRFVSSKNNFDEIRTNNQQPMSDLECFLAFITDKLSPSAKKVLETAQKRYRRYDALLDFVIKKSKGVSKANSLPKFEATQIKAIVDFEIKDRAKDKTWNFQYGGLDRVNDDFFLLNEYLETSQSDRFRRLCSKWGYFLLSEEESAEIAKAPAEKKTELTIKKVGPQLQPVWSFFVALCHALQEGENELNATDAFWLGLVDEIMGLQDLPYSRLFQEYQPDPEEAKDAKKETS